MTDTLKVITNNVPRLEINAYELNAKERAEFDYLDWPAIERGEASTSFMRYLGTLYDLGEFMTTGGLPESNPLRKWDGYLNDSFFSGVVVRYCSFPDWDHVIVGRFYS